MVRRCLLRKLLDEGVDTVTGSLLGSESTGQVEQSVCGKMKGLPETTTWDRSCEASSIPDRAGLSIYGLCWASHASQNSHLALFSEALVLSEQVGDAPHRSSDD